MRYPRTCSGAQEAGFDQHLAKPPSMEGLEEVLATLARDGSEGRGPRNRLRTDDRYGGAADFAHAPVLEGDHGDSCLGKAPRKNVQPLRIALRIDGECTSY